MKAPTKPQVQKSRDLVLLQFPKVPLNLVIACDSLGAIGPKPHDVVLADGYTVGRFTARVPLMEVMAVGAIPQVLVDTLSVEMNPSGAAILRGIHDELQAAGLPDVVVTGSTEENVLTAQTGIGITVIGTLDDNRPRIATSRPGLLVVCLGLPKVGEAVQIDDLEIATPRLIQQLVELDFVAELLPVGSKGANYEASLMAAMNGAIFDPISTKVDLAQSAGPATCVLVTVAPPYLVDLENAIDVPIEVIGRLKE